MDTEGISKIVNKYDDEVFEELKERTKYFLIEGGWVAVPDFYISALEIYVVNRGWNLTELMLDAFKELDKE